MEQLFEKYKNIQLFATSKKYRGMTLDGQFLSYQEFSTKMQNLGYIMHSFKGQNAQKVLIFFFKKDSKYINSAPEFGKLLDKHKDSQHIILITKKEVTVYIKRAILSRSHLKIDNYLHVNFIMELSKGPLCAEHEIIDIKSDPSVIIDIMALPDSLPAISITDPQIIWLGAKCGDVIRIRAKSELTGETIRYRVVKPENSSSEPNMGIPAPEEVKTEPDEKKEIEETLDEEYQSEDYEI